LKRFELLTDTSVELILVYNVYKILSSWLIDFDKKMKKPESKFILFFNNATWHLDSKL